MKVVVLAAGRSKRMQPIKDKNFLNFLGKPLIQHQLEFIKKAGFDDVVVVGGEHNFDKLKDVAKLFGAQTILQENLDLGMCGAILSARELIGSEPILIFSSNDLVEEKAFEIMKRAFETEDADSFIIGKKVFEYFPGGYLDTDNAGFIKRIVEKPGQGNEPNDLINLVVHIHKNPQKLIKFLQNAKSDNDDLYEVALTEMIAGGEKMKVVPYEGFWHPIKFPWHVQPVFQYLFETGEKKIAESAQISEKATIRGEVIIGENVKIMDNAVISGPVYLGDNTVVTNNCLVRESHVGANSVIGFATEVARSYLGENVWTHSNYLGDSVIGNDVSFGAGTVIGNLRLDEKDIVEKQNKFGIVTGDAIRVGINTSFMPGVKIGGNCFIGAGIVIAEDIPEGKFVRGKFELKISDNFSTIRSEKRAVFKKMIND